jgi:hypothetical protein
MLVYKLIVRLECSVSFLEVGSQPFWLGMCLRVIRSYKAYLLLGHNLRYPEKHLDSPSYARHPRAAGDFLNLSGHWQ